MSKRTDLLKKYCDCSEYVCADAVYVEDYDTTKPTILILDDQESVITLFNKLIRRMKLKDKFNIITLTGDDVVIKVFKLLNTQQEISIDILITDITFGGSVKVGEQIVNYDGVELTGILKEIFPNLLYRFLTGHNVAEISTPWIYNEYKAYSDDEILDHVSIKDKPITNNRELILKTVKGTKYEALIE